MKPVTPLFSATARPAPGSRHGQAWEASDYALLAQGVRERLDVPQLAKRIGRNESTVPQRLRRLLPVAKRACPLELVLDAVRTALADPDYDWQAEMLLSPPPAPIIHNEIVHTGIAGLDDEQLVIIGYALMAASPELNSDLLSVVFRQLDERDLLAKVVNLRAHRSARASPLPISEDAAWANAMFWVHGHTTPAYWRGRIADASDW